MTTPTTSYLERYGSPEAKAFLEGKPKAKRRGSERCWSCGGKVLLDSDWSQHGICPHCDADLDDDPQSPFSTVARQRREQEAASDPDHFDPDPMRFHSL